MNKLLLRKMNRHHYKNFAYYCKKLRIKILKQIKLKNKWIVNKKENKKTWKIKKKDFGNKSLK